MSDVYDVKRGRRGPEEQHSDQFWDPSNMLALMADRGQKFTYCKTANLEKDHLVVSSLEGQLE